ncbi:MAG: class I SAM-dependent methyltransferase [Desulfobaccales bacterium]
MINTDQKVKQLSFYAHIDDPEEEINRPRGYPLFVQFLLDFKIDQSLGLLRGPFQDLSVLVVCGGSGMDSEKLERRGLKVTMTDISPEAIARARERACRYGLSYRAQVADAECLPFTDRAFDLVFVHDGLHHLSDPYVTIREMARVARHAVIIAEPQDQVLTRLAVRLGISEKWEDAGNFVYRLNGPALAAALKDLGFPNSAWSSHLIYYQPWTFPIYRLFSQNLLLRAAKAAFFLTNGLLGRWGNSLKFIAWR